MLEKKSVQSFTCSVRVIIGQVIGRVKVFGVLKNVFRGELWRHKIYFFVCCQLANSGFASSPLSERFVVVSEKVRTEWQALNGKNKIVFVNFRLLQQEKEGEMNQTTP